MKNIIFAAVLSVIATTSVNAQGPLTPPGPPAPTMLTLSQIEPRTPISSLPYTISIPGSYYVATNMTCTACTNGQNGISIVAGNVTLDLKGFTLQGVAGSGSGVGTGVGLGNLAIYNGVIDAWGQMGVAAPYVYNSQFERLRVSNSGATGLLTGSNCLMLVCTANGNGGQGINGGNNSAVKDCTANGNGGQGIEVGNDSTVNACTANGNYGASSFGIEVWNSCSVKDCTASGNLVGGIEVQGNDCLIAGNNCSTNGNITGTMAIGISVNGVRNRIDNNNAGNNAYGPSLVGGIGIFPNSVNVANSITRNSAPGNEIPYYNYAGNNDYAPTGTPATATSPWTNF